MTYVEWARRRQRLSQPELSEKVGMNRRRLLQFETGRRSLGDLRHREVEALAEALDVDKELVTQMAADVLSDGAG